MKEKIIPGIIVLAAAGGFLWCLSACIVPTGGCRYYKTPVEKGEVTVLSVKKVSEGSRELYRIDVRGYLNRHVILAPEEFAKCNNGRGIKAGDKMTGVMVPGSPCPPLYKLEGCR